MVEKIELKKFKRFNDKTIELKKEGVSVIAGGNNSGKSTIIHALAVWEYCKTFLEFEKGKKSLIRTYTGQGIGVSYNDFSPISIPNLKYLWTNLKPYGGYSLKIKCYWRDFDDSTKFLEFGLALANERLFIKPLSSNLDINSKIPKIAFLPTFAGISENEGWFSAADRNRMIGRGLAGAILRNMIIDMYNKNLEKRRKAKEGKRRVSKVDLDNIRNNDPFEVLNNVLFDIFQVKLYPQFFNPTFHTNTKVYVSKGEIVDKRFKPYKNYNKRDIMVEGSGFLQWLSVFTFASNDDIDVLLLDEPDAHLHSSLQDVLLDNLLNIANAKGKQILLASHSSEIIKNIPPDSLMVVDGSSVKYLNDDRQKIGVLAGLGSTYSPILHKLQKNKKFLFVENKSDSEILKTICERQGKTWPEDVVIWPLATRHSERKHIILKLSEEIDGLTGISLIDRDREEIATTSVSLKDMVYLDDLKDGNSRILLRYRKWRRRHIESYLVLPCVIARISGKSEQDIEMFIEQEFSLKIPSNYQSSEHSNQLDALFHIDSKQVLSLIAQQFNINKYQIAENILQNEICDDFTTLIDVVISL